MNSNTDFLAPWDIQPGEPETSYAGFVLYRSQPPQSRSTRAVARELARSHSLIDRYSSAWHWVTRARAWDAELARRATAAREDVLTEVQTRQLEEARRLTVFGMATLEQYINRDPSGRVVGVTNIPLRDALTMLRIGMQTERLAAGVHAEPDVAADFVMTVLDVFVSAFMEVNELEDAQARRTAFEERCSAAVERLLADDIGVAPAPSRHR